MGQLQYCCLMTISTPLLFCARAKLLGRALVNPVRYFRKADRSRLSFPDPLPDMKHLTVDNDGVKLHAVTHGLGTGKPLLLFLHGFPDTWAAWHHQFKEFAGKYEIVAMDLRGYGASDAPKSIRAYAVDKLCSDVAAVIAAAGHTKATLVGHSWGGNVAWHFSVLHPHLTERLVVLCAPHPSAFLDPQRFDSKQVEKTSFSVLCQFGPVAESTIRHRDFFEVERMFTKAPAAPLTPGAITPEYIERCKAALSHPGTLTGALNVIRASFLATTKWDLPAAEKPMYTPVSAPTLVLYAQQDVFMLPQMFQEKEKLVENLRAVRLNGCSHWAQQDKPELVNSLIKDFLSKPAPTTADGKAAPGPAVAVQAGGALTASGGVSAAGSGGATPLLKKD